MKIPKSFYLVSCVIGTLVPWFFFIGFFVGEGINFSLFLKSLFINSVAAGFSSDVLISILIFWVWSYADARTNRIRNWWVVIVAGCTVGLSLALPLYLYLRNKKQE